MYMYTDIRIPAHVIRNIVYITLLRTLSFGRQAILSTSILYCLHNLSVDTRYCCLFFAPRLWCSEHRTGFCCIFCIPRLFTAEHVLNSTSCQIYMWCDLFIRATRLIHVWRQNMWYILASEHVLNTSSMWCDLFIRATRLIYEWRQNMWYILIFTPRRHVTHEWVMSHLWMSHVTPMNESCHTYEWVMESCHTYEWVMSHIWMSHGTHMNHSCHTWMSFVAHMNESCHRYEWAMSHLSMSHVAHANSATKGGNAESCSVLQCVAVRCSVIQCVAVCCGVVRGVAVRCSIHM